MMCRLAAVRFYPPCAWRPAWAKAALPTNIGATTSPRPCAGEVKPTGQTVYTTVRHLSLLLAGMSADQHSNTRISSRPSRPYLSGRPIQRGALQRGRHFELLKDHSIELQTMKSSSTRPAACRWRNLRPRAQAQRPTASPPEHRRLPATAAMLRYGRRSQEKPRAGNHRDHHQAPSPLANRAHSDHGRCRNCRGK